MLDLYEKTQEACSVIQKKWGQKPHAGIILGTGLGSLVKKIDVQAEFEYSEIPHFLKSTATSHRGRLLCGELSGVPVVAMEGRFHMYEGYPLDRITLPVRVMKFLGAQLLMVSNACGGMNPNFQAGDIMLIEDHINLMGGNPLIGINDDRLGPRFPDMSQPYDHRLIREALRIARKSDIIAHQGVFVAVAGPNLETRAEYRFLRQIGADVVGMSTCFWPTTQFFTNIGTPVLRASGTRIDSTLGGHRNNSKNSNNSLAMSSQRMHLQTSWVGKPFAGALAFLSKQV